MDFELWKVTNCQMQWRGHSKRHSYQASKHTESQPLLFRLGLTVLFQIEKFHYNGGKQLGSDSVITTYYFRKFNLFWLCYVYLCEISHQLCLLAQHKVWGMFLISYKTSTSMVYFSWTKVAFSNSSLEMMVLGKRKEHT